MAYDYNRAKQVWDSMNDQQKKQYTEQNKNDANFQQFAQQYHEEKQQTAPRQVQANVNVDNLQNQQPAAQRDSNWVYTGNTEWEKEQNRRMLQDQSSNQWVTKTITPQEMQESINKAQDQIKNQNASPEFDSSRLTNPNAEVSVKEGKAAQTWTPDYEEDSEARMNEITNNLNAYWNSNKSYFSDRATFNSTFHYNDRSDKQKALLDSFWKWTQDQIKANSYHNWDEIMSGFDNWEITPDIMSYLRTYNEDAYDEWQKKMEDKVNTLIANMAAPRDVWDTAELWQNIVKKFWLEAWDPYDIYWEWSRRAEELWVFRDSQQLASMSNNIASIYSTMNSNVQSISSQLEGRYSAWYIAARIDKANSKLNSQAQSMQYSYNLLLQNRNQNMAIAQQAAAMKQAQGQEDSRIFNQKLAWLGFAMTADSYRTPEQQAQLQLQTAQIQNDLNLLNQGNRDQLDLYKQRQLNQLEITHMHDLAEAQDQINYERTDLTVENEGLLRKNLSNVLDEYYSKFWDMIQRPKSQVIEDVLAYAREHNVSVAEALKKDFIEQLQNKAQYKSLLNKQTWYDPTAWQQSWVWVDNWDWTSSLKISWVGKVPDNLSRTQRVQEYTNIYNQVWEDVAGFSIALAQSIANGNTTWQCWAFANDYLKALWITNWFTDYLDEKMTKINQDYPTLWSVAIMDFWVKDKNWKPYGHVWIVSWINADWSIVITDSNWAWDEKKLTHTLSANDMKYVKWYYNPNADLQKTLWTTTWASSFEWNGNTYDYGKYSWWNNLTDDEKLTVENLLTYQTDPASLPKSWKDNWASNQRVRAAAAAIWRDYWWNERKYSLVKNAEKKWDDAALPWGVSSANSTSMSILKAMYDSYAKGFNKYDINTINRWINDFKAETWDPTVWTQYATSRVAASEIAKALKWGASATEQEVEDMKKLLNWNMWNEQAMAVFQSFAKNLYEKNESEAKKFYETAWYKPNPIWTDEAQEWMTTLGIDLSKYYNYQWLYKTEVETATTWSPSYWLNFTSKY